MSESSLREILQILHALKQKAEESWETSIHHEREDIKRFEKIEKRLDRIEKRLEMLEGER